MPETAAICSANRAVTKKREQNKALSYHTDAKANFPYTASMRPLFLLRAQFMCTDLFRYRLLECQRRQVQDPEVGREGILVQSRGLS
ncbi:GD24250 [Drosophila simulans]|uniref:GD24250 n=1 Tax=Drosophila simulans TaxID=7240 RepID=B4QAI3_DROSI|nr:GD24250 [Drosophila simulans]